MHGEQLRRVSVRYAAIGGAAPRTRMRSRLLGPGSSEGRPVNDLTLEQLLDASDILSKGYQETISYDEWVNDDVLCSECEEMLATSWSFLADRGFCKWCFDWYVDYTIRQHQKGKEDGSKNI